MSKELKNLPQAEMPVFYFNQLYFKKVITLKTVITVYSTLLVVVAVIVVFIATIISLRREMNNNTNETSWLT